MPVESEDSVTLSIPSAQRAALDKVARAVQREPSDLIRDAIEAYIAVHDWQAEHVAAGLAQADAGQFATTEEVDRAFARWK